MSMGVFRTGRDVSTLFAFKSGRILQNSGEAKICGITGSGKIEECRNTNIELH